MGDLRRRELLAAGAAGAVSAGALSLAGQAAAATGSGPPTLPESDVDYTFPLTRTEPTVTTDGGTVVEVTEENFPVLTGNKAAVFLLTLEPGALREPHWHPNAWEFDICIEGTGKLGVVTPEGEQKISVLERGDVGFIPRAWAHFIQNPGDKPMRFAVFFNDSQPDDVGLSTMFAGMPTKTFTETFGMPRNGLAAADKPDETLFIVD
jgi:oxalate decarboxylase